MPEANPAGPHKKAADAMLKARIGLANANAAFPRAPETDCSGMKRLSPLDMARFPMSESRRVMGVPRRPKVSTERGV
jgi:hypothetical protein